jgi:hypothetical protein
MTDDQGRAEGKEETEEEEMAHHSKKDMAS